MSNLPKHIVYIAMQNEQASKQLLNITQAHLKLVRELQKPSTTQEEKVEIVNIINALKVERNNILNKFMESESND